MSEKIDVESIVKSICNEHNFNLLGNVGSGTFKETFCVQNMSGEQFALKLFKSGDLDARSEREINTMLRCDHPGIAKVIHIGEYEKFPYLIEDFFEGGTLHQRLDEGGLFSPDQIIVLGQELIEAISHIASLNLVHRDIKPENILFQKDNDSPIITDFGIARDLDATSLTNTMWASGPCTPPFAAPEQLNNEKSLIDWRTDQFSLAITLIVCGYGDHPFREEGNSIENAIIKVQNRESISPGFEEFIRSTELVALRRMLGLWPVERYPTPEELLTDWNLQRR